MNVTYPDGHSEFEKFVSSDAMAKKLAEVIAKDDWMTIALSKLSAAETREAKNAILTDATGPRATLPRIMATAHVADAPSGAIQRCVRCGMVLQEYDENTMTTDPNFRPVFWPTDETVAISEGNPRMTARPDGFVPGTVNFYDCGKKAIS